MCAEILALPKGLRVVPEEHDEYFAWYDKMMKYRIDVRRLADGDPIARRDIVAAAAADVAYDFLLFGCAFEPRTRIDRPRGWYPLIPFAFQVDLIRWLDEVCGVVSGTEAARMGRGDGIIEKARGMAGTVTVSCRAASKWKYDDGYVAAFLSYKEDLVEKQNDTGTIFHKIEAYLGLDVRVPLTRALMVDGNLVDVPLRSPLWMVPEGYDVRRHNQQLALGHPQKTNSIVGATTTEKAGTGTRVTEMYWDEAAKYAEFWASWSGAAEVTDHRIGLSSADTRYGTGFRDLARHAEHAVKHEEQGPAFFRLKADRHPDKDDLWRAEIEGRHSGVHGAAEAMAREYDLDYEAGGTRYIYLDYCREAEPRQLEFKPSTQVLDFCLDPGIADMCAFHLVAYDKGKDSYNLMLSYVNSEKPADFYASLVLASPLYNLYDYDDDEDRVMEFFQEHGRRIRYFVGDPAGKHRGGGKATSFYEEFAKATGEMSDGRSRINIWSSDKNDYKLIPKRIDSLRWLLPKMEFNNTPDVELTLAALRDHHWPTINYDRQPTNLPRTPVHSWGHDRVTALEYYACHRRIGFSADSQPRPAALVLGASGKPWSRPR